VELSGDAHPRYEVVWKLSDKEPEAVDAEEWIAKKGIAAKGKKCAERGEVKTVRFIEPLVVDEPEAPEEAPAGPDEDLEEPAEAPVTPSEAPAAPAEPPVLPTVEPEPSPNLDEVPDFPGGLFDEPTLF
jgi:topoisomerase-4 subunit A